MIAVILGTGFEPMEAITTTDILRRAGLQVMTASIGEKTAAGAHGITVQADVTVDELDADKLDMVVLPGGMGGVHSILASEKTLSLIKTVYDRGGYAAAICAAPTVLAKLHIIDGKKATCYPGLESEMGSAIMQDVPAVRDGNVICGRAPGASAAFGLLIVKTLCGEEVCRKVADGLVLD